VNKYDTLSLSHLLVYLSALKAKQKLVTWKELKEILELCKVKNLK
jgi:hypothetical protein